MGECRPGIGATSTRLVGRRGGEVVFSHGTPHCSGLWVLNANTGSKKTLDAFWKQRHWPHPAPMAARFPGPGAGHRSHLQWGETPEKRLLPTCPLPKCSPLQPRPPPLHRWPSSTQQTWLVPVAGGQRFGGGGMLLKEPRSPARPVPLPPTPSHPLAARIPFPLSKNRSVCTDPSEEQRATTHRWGQGRHLPWLMDGETEAQGGRCGFAVGLPEPEPGRA